jgi:acyl-CoA synthetase (NDP forming)
MPSSAMRSAETFNGIRSFFEPHSIAVAGVSTDKNKLASIIFSNLRHNIDRGILNASLYALNPSHDHIGRIPSYASIDRLPEVPELLIVAIPVSSTLQLIEKAANAGVKAVIIITSGFAESGRRSLETRVRSLAKNHHMRILGPNTFGLLDTHSGVDSIFLPDIKKLPSGREIISFPKPIKGNVAIITQSGHLGAIVSEEFAAYGIGIRAIVGTGNQLDVSVEDIIKYLVDDNQTKVMAVYLEGLSDGRRFMQIASTAAKKKPIVVFKVGKTEVGARAALTHTASLVGDYGVYRAAFRQSGLIEADDLQELSDYCVSLSLLPRSRGRRLLVVTNAGGVGAIAADEAGKSGLEVIPPSKKTVRLMRERFRNSSFVSNAMLGNPLDLTASATTNEFVKVTEFVLALPEYDMLLVMPTHQTPLMEADASTRLAEVVVRAQKPTCICVMGHSALATLIRKDFAANGIPSFPTPERAVRALAAVCAYREASSRGKLKWH